MPLCYNVSLCLPAKTVRFVRHRAKVCRLNIRHSRQLFLDGRPRSLALHNKTHARK